MIDVILRLYQEAAIEALRDSIRRGHKKIILQLETGSGKTVIAIAMIISAVLKSKSCLFISRGRKIVGQTSEKLWHYGVNHSVMMSKEEDHPASVIVASKDTMASWVKRRKIVYPKVDLVFVDEAHESLSGEFLKIIKHYEEAGVIIIGLTATPARKGGLGMGDVYTDLVQVIKTTELISQGHLVPTTVYAPHRPDLKGIKTSGGDYNKDAIAKVMDRTQLTGDVIQHWKELGEDRPTLCYCTTVAHSVHVCEQFNKAGIPAKHMDADTDDDERKVIIDELCNGTVKVITSVGVLNQGVDIPPASCAINLRPTKSLVFYRQMIGRIRRTFPGKTSAILIDHAGSVYLHGFPDSDIEWTLAKGEKVQDRMAKNRKEGKTAEPIHCPKCHAMFSGASQCPNCGYVMRTRGKPVNMRNGKLIQVNGSDHIDLREDMQRHWHRCLAMAVNRGRTAKAAIGMFRGQWDRLPWDAGVQPLANGKEWGMLAADLFPQYSRRKGA